MNLSNYATKADLKLATGLDTSSLVSQTDSACLKTKIYNLDVDKLKTVPADLSKLINVVNNDVVKICIIDCLSTLLILGYS